MARQENFESDLELTSSTRPDFIASIYSPHFASSKRSSTRNDDDADDVDEKKTADLFTDKGYRRECVAINRARVLCRLGKFEEALDQMGDFDSCEVILLLLSPSLSFSFV